MDEIKLEKRKAINLLYDLIFIEKNDEIELLHQVSDKYLNAVIKVISDMMVDNFGDKKETGLRLYSMCTTLDPRFFIYNDNKIYYIGTTIIGFHIMKSFGSKQEATNFIKNLKNTARELLSR
ncbi:hypothetical protein KAR34_06200 [bacterium]|nr:hypothetical protein [bacterium]